MIPVNTRFEQRLLLAALQLAKKEETTTALPDPMSAEATALDLHTVAVQRRIAAEERINQLAGRILCDPVETDTIQIGHIVEIQHMTENGVALGDKIRFRLVGHGMGNPEAYPPAWEHHMPLCRALLGKKKGDTIRSTPGGKVTVVLGIEVPTSSELLNLLMPSIGLEPLLDEEEQPSLFDAAMKAA